MKRAYKTQKAEQERKRDEMRAEDDRLRDILLKKFAEDERVEQMNDQKRRLRVEAHKREAQRLIDLRKAAFTQMRDEERAFEQKKRDDEASRQTVIEEERRQLIKDFAIPLKDFLPKGTLQTADDFDLIFRQDRPELGKRPGNLTAR